jgi:hypothetical protein
MDLLVKVYRMNGRESYILLHLEIQDQVKTELLAMNNPICPCSIGGAERAGSTKDREVLAAITPI